MRDEGRESSRGMDSDESAVDAVADDELEGTRCGDRKRAEFNKGKQIGSSDRGNSPCCLPGPAPIILSIFRCN